MEKVYEFHLLFLISNVANFIKEFFWLSWLRKKVVYINIEFISNNLEIKL